MANFQVPTEQFTISTSFSLASLGAMLVVAVMLIVSRFREAALPRRPDTLGAVMSYLDGSLLDEFGVAACENEASEEERSQLMEKKKYTLKAIDRGYGQLAWTIIATTEHSSYGCA